MTKIDVFSGFLGAGKTTLIKKLIQEAYQGEKVVLIENEFGEIGIDGGFLEEAGINITEMNSGCICCSLVGDFSAALKKVAVEYAPDRILIEPSGVGKLSDVIKAVEKAELENAKLNAFCCVVDAKKAKMYLKNFGEFFGDQVKNASCIVLSHVNGLSSEKLATAVELLKEKNQTATFVTSDWDSLSGKDILAAMEKSDSLEAELARLRHEHEHHHEHHHEHDHECDDPNCCCHGHHHEHHEECCHEHEHHHHEHDHECDDPNCCCHGHHHEHHEHHHDHHGHHHADDVFTSWGVETTRVYSKAEMQEKLSALQDKLRYGVVLRAKGIVAGEGAWIHFDYVPEEADVREGGAAVTGRLCVIGCNLNEGALKELFGV
ncbi:MAG: GTP-binding protein [Clostridia bacterium]|nr:GTP-binding protein [Clostridia bacterium]